MEERTGMAGEEQVRQYFEALMGEWGPQDWWPAHSAFEVIVGAYLTQNTAWTNVEQALRGLRRDGALSVEGIRRTSLPRLEQMVRSAGYFRQKAQRLKTFVDFLDGRYGGSLRRMFAEPTAKLREELLALNGIGPETADSILLYAGGHPVFVVDAYTRRVFERHGLLRGKEKYQEIRDLFERAMQEASPEWESTGFSARKSLPGRKRHKFALRSRHQRAKIFDEYHALLVQVAKHHCFKKAAACEGCPLERFLPPSGPFHVPQAKLSTRKNPRRHAGVVAGT